MTHKQTAGFCITSLFDVLGIVALLAVAAFMAYPIVEVNVDTNRETERFTSIRTDLAHRPNQDGWPSLSDNRYGPVAVATRHNHFAVTYSNIPPYLCEKFISNITATIPDVRIRVDGSFQNGTDEIEQACHKVDETGDRKTISVAGPIHPRSP